MSEQIIEPATLPSAATPTGTSILTAEQFRALAAVPPEIEWFANIDNSDYYWVASSHCTDYKKPSQHQHIGLGFWNC